MPIKILSGRKFWLALAVGWTLAILIACLVSFKKFPSVGLNQADKYVHLMFHLVFTLLWFQYYRQGIKRPLLKIFIASLLYGGLIEILQSALTTTRKADLRDIAANACGATLAVLIVLLGRKYRKN